MSATAPPAIRAPARQHGRNTVVSIKAAAVLVSVVMLVASLSLVAYVRVGWSGMGAACSADPPGGRHWTSVELGWSWTPLGFQCTYDDGSRRTSLWF